MLQPAGTRLRRASRSQLRRIRAGGTAALARAGRLGAAAVVAYLIATHVVERDPRPVTAALTALLIVQVTLVGTVTDTALRLVSVVVGVTTAIGVSTLVNFTWWSLAAIVVVGLLLGQLLRLGSHLLEVPISGMLVLAAGQSDIVALDRVFETLIGAGVGVAINIVLPPRIRTRSAGAAIERFAESMAALLDRVADTLGTRPAEADEARAWLHEARSIATRIDEADRVLAEAGESRRWNPRALGTTDQTPDLRSGLDALEHSAVALRAVFRSIADDAHLGRRRGGSDRPGDEGEAPDEPSDDLAADLRQALAVLMSDLARAVSAFGTLVRAELDVADEPHTAELADALDALQEARVRLTELLLVDPREAPGEWQVRGSLLAGVERVLAELDVEGRRRQRQQRLEADEQARRPAAQAARRIRSTTRRVVAEAAPPPVRRLRRKSD